MSIKISKISYFSFTFKLNEKKKDPLKKFDLERGVTWKFWLEVAFIYSSWVGNISKKRWAWPERGQEKLGGLWPSKKLWGYSYTYSIYSLLKTLGFSDVQIFIFSTTVNSWPQSSVGVTSSFFIGEIASGITKYLTW